MVRFELSDENENFGILTASQYFTDFSDDVCGEILMGVILMLQKRMCQRLEVCIHQGIDSFEVTNGRC